MPNTGPSEGSRSAQATDSPICLKPWARPIEVVSLPPFAVPPSSWIDVSVTVRAAPCGFSLVLL